MYANDYQPRKLKNTHLDEFYSNGFLEDFLKAISDLITCGDIPGKDLEIELVGEHLQEFWLRSLGLHEVVVKTKSKARSGPPPADEADCQAGAVLFVQRGAWNGYVPERFFELQTLGTRVLAMVPNPVAYEEYCFINSNLYVVGNKDFTGLKKAIAKLYQDWLAELLEGGDDSVSTIPGNITTSNEV